MSRRDDLISTARRMFRARGYHATGIDAVLAESGAAKATLYSLFGSKEALILAVLQTEDRDFHEGLERAMSEQSTPTERVLAILDFAGRWFRSDDFNGCMFANAAAEFTERDGAIRQLVAAHKRGLLNLMEAELSRADVADPSAVARQLQMLFEGATIMAKITGDPSAASAAREAAMRLIQAPQTEAPSTKAKSLVRALMNSGDPR